MILSSTNSQQSARRHKRFRPRRIGTAAIASLVAVIVMLVSSQPSNAESRYNYDRQSYDSRGASAANNQNTSLSTAQTTTYEVHRTSRPTRTKYDECRTLCIVTVSSDQLRWLPTWRYGLQISVLVLVLDYDEPPNSLRKTCCLSAKNEMSQYRAYFVPGAVDPMGLQQAVFNSDDGVSFRGDVQIEGQWNWSGQKTSDITPWTREHAKDYDQAFLGLILNMEADFWYKFASSVVARGNHVAVAAKSSGIFDRHTSIVRLIPTGYDRRKAEEVTLIG